MFSRILAVITVTFIVFQIIFSFYYSSEIINQNDLLQQNQKQLNLLNLQNSELEDKVASFSAISNLTQKINPSFYFPITHHVQF